MMALGYASLKFPIPGDFWSGTFGEFFAAIDTAYEQPILHNDMFLLTGTLPVETSEEFRRELPSFTEGEGVFMAQEAGFLKIEGECPTRKRMDHNPLNRKEYMLHVHHVC